MLLDGITKSSERNARGLSVIPKSGDETGGHRVIRQRVLDSMTPLVPLTMLVGLPGTAKTSLLRQLHAQLLACRLPDDPPVVLVDFPRRRMGDKEAVALAAESVRRVTGQAPGSEELVSRLRRGQFDIKALEQEAEAFGREAAGMVCLLANFEWQASPMLEHLLVSFVRAGIDIVCTLVDSSSLESFAMAQGVTTRVVGDAELVFTKEEVSRVALQFGIDPTPDLISQVLSLTAGHPMLTSAMFLRLKGVDRAVVEGGVIQVPAVGEGGADVSHPAAESFLRSLSPRPVTADVSGFGPQELRQAASLLRQDDFSRREFMASCQGSSLAMRVLAQLITVDGLDLDAIEEVLPGSARLVGRLCGAGYLRLELGQHISGRVVWNCALRAVARDWGLEPVDEDGTPTRLQGLREDLVSWYMRRERLDDAMALLVEGGSPEDLADFVERHFIAIMLSGPPQGFDPAPLLSSAHAPRSTAVVILSALQVPPNVRLDAGVERRLEEVLRLLMGRSGEGSAGQRLGAIAQILVLEGLLDRWEENPELDTQGIAAVDEAMARGDLDTSGAARALALLGTLSLVRGNLEPAWIALTRTLVVSTQGSLVWTRAAASAIVLEGYTGASFLDETIDRDVVLRALAEQIHAEDARWEWLRVLGLARSWLLAGDGNLEGALGELEKLVREQEHALESPMVQWSRGLLLLLTGEAEQARAVHVEASRRRAAGPGNVLPSARSVLGSVLASLSTGRLDEALQTAARRPDHRESIDRFTADVLRLAAGHEDPDGLPLGAEAEADAEVYARVSPRFRTMRMCVRVARLVREGREEAAGALLTSFAARIAPSDLIMVLRLISREDTRRILRLLDSGVVLPPGFRDVIEDAVDAPHVLVEGLVRSGLSPAERSVLQALGRGLGNHAIAEELFLSVNTVKTHLRSIYRQLGVRTRREAVSRAQNLGILGAADSELRNTSSQE